jgi:hypothetical protein
MQVSNNQSTSANDNQDIAEMYMFKESLRKAERLKLDRKDVEDIADPIQQSQLCELRARLLSGMADKESGK